MNFRASAYLYQINFQILFDDCHFNISDVIRASASHCQIDCQISFGNCHLNFRDAETRQN
jgi:hypothetical protein